MAFYNDDELEQQQLANGEKPPTTSVASSEITGQGSKPGQTSQAPAAPSSTTPGTPDNPGNFVGITDYLKANQSQSAKLGDKVSSKVSEDVNAAQSQLGGLNDQFKSTVDQNKLQGLDTASDDANRIVNTAATGQAGSNLTDPDKQRINQITNARYQGPKTVEETEIWNPAVQSVNKAKQTADLTKSEAGQGTILKHIYKNPGYSSGENLFDTLLLGANASDREKIQQAVNPVNNFQSILDAVSVQGRDYAKGVSDLTDQVREGARSNVAGTQSSRANEIQSALAQSEAGIDSVLAGIQEKLADPSGNAQLTPEELAILGLDANENIYGLSADDVARNLKKNFDKNTFITKDQQAQLAALDAIAQGYGGDQVNPFTMSELAGTDSKGITDPTKGIDDVIAQKKAAYEQGKANTHVNLQFNMGADGPSPFSIKEVEGIVDGAMKHLGFSTRDQLEAFYRQSPNHWGSQRMLEAVLALKKYDSDHKINRIAGGQTIKDINSRGSAKPPIVQ